MASSVSVCVAPITPMQSLLLGIIIPFAMIIQLFIGVTVHGIYHHLIYLN